VHLLAEKETLIVVASLVHCCAVKKNVIVASQLHGFADVQLTVEKKGPLHFCSLFKSRNLGTLFQI